MKIAMSDLGCQGLLSTSRERLLQCVEVMRVRKTLLHGQNWPLQVEAAIMIGVSWIETLEIRPPWLLWIDSSTTDSLTELKFG